MRSSFSALMLAATLSLIAVGCSSTPAQEPCGPANCNGCCTLEGECRDGTTETACGTGGAACEVCIADQTCSAQSCQLLVGDGGNDTDAGMDQDAGMDVDAGMDTDAGMEMDAGMDLDAGMDAGASTEPIVAPTDTWTWVDFPNAVCGNGTATGIGINPSTNPDDVFIYMQGGGACWDGLTCFTLKTASNLDGYDGTDFAADSFTSAFAVDRTQMANPFKDMSFVYVPYCTGDVHAGDAVKKYGSNPDLHHKGAKNVDAFLSRLAPTFPSVKRVFLGGSSAGAFGAQLNYERVAAAFPTAEVHVLADSGQMITPSGTRLNAWLAAWNFTLPAGCMNCTTDFTLYPEYLAKTYPTRRFALTAYDQDNVLRNFFGFTATQYQTATMDLLANRYDPNSNARYFLLVGTDHTMLGQQGTLAAPSGETLNDWITDFVNGDPGWANVKP